MTADPSTEPRRGPIPDNWDNAITIYVSNLPYYETEVDLKNIFAPFGRVLTVKMLRQYGTGEFLGTAFVVMENRADGLKAIEELNATVHETLRLKVEESRRPYDPFHRPSVRRSSPDGDRYAPRRDRRERSPPRREDRDQPRRYDDGYRRGDDDRGFRDRYNDRRESDY
jgi:RNA recognition motif-containing protein